MRGSDKQFLFWDCDGRAWVCDGGPGYYRYSSPDKPSCDEPGTCGYSTLSFHMNWGWVNGSYNGWYGFNNVNVGGNNYEHDRKNLYINPK